MRGTALRPPFGMMPLSYPFENYFKKSHRLRVFAYSRTQLSPDCFTRCAYFAFSGSVLLSRVFLLTARLYASCHGRHLFIVFYVGFSLWLRRPTDASGHTARAFFTFYNRPPTVLFLKAVGRFFYVLSRSLRYNSYILPGIDPGVHVTGRLD